MWPPMGYKHLTVLMEVLKQNQTLKDKKPATEGNLEVFTDT